MPGGRLFVISAPSGTGKTTVLKRIMKEFPEMRFSVSYTTRPPRLGEKEGVDYHFISRDEFQKMIGGDEFAEWTEVHGNYYGTPKALLDECVARGTNMILDIDTHGAKQIQKRFPNGVFIFILPPGIGDLKERLARRGSESQEMIDLRLQNATKEIEKIRNYDYVVVNERIDDTADRIKSIIAAESSRQKAMSHGPKETERA